MKRTARVAVMWDPSVSGAPREAIEAAARAAGITLLSLRFRRTSDLEPAIDRADRERVQAVSVLPSPMLIASWARIVELALKHRLPLMAVGDRQVRAGGLMYYGATSRAMHARLASYIDRILKGARPAELPIERPTEFSLLINNKTAEALGLTIPQSLLLRADEVIR